MTDNTEIPADVLQLLESWGCPPQPTNQKDTAVTQINDTYRAGVYANRVAVFAPKNLGPVDARAVPVDGGVMIRLVPHHNGALKGTPSPTQLNEDAWSYAWRPHEDLPLIGASPAEVRITPDAHGQIGLFLAEGRKVQLHKHTPRKPKVAAPEPGPLPTPTTPLTRRGEMVREINAWKDELGDTLVLSITPEGKLRALVEYS